MRKLSLRNMAALIQGVSCSIDSFGYYVIMRKLIKIFTNIIVNSKAALKSIILALTLKCMLESIWD
jgi:hypothetical protein